jgi:hypothetical protein
MYQVPYQSITLSSSYLCRSLIEVEFCNLRTRKRGNLGYVTCSAELDDEWWTRRFRSPLGHVTKTRLCRLKKAIRPCRRVSRPPYSAC